MPVEMEKIMAVFLTVIASWFSCHSKRSKNILVKVLSGMFSLGKCSALETADKPSGGYLSEILALQSPAWLRKACQKGG